MDFPCSKCGICCKSISQIPQLSDYDPGNGVCRYLSRDNNCSIYESRPQICRVDEMYDQFFKDKMGEDEFVKLNLAACCVLRAKNWRSNPLDCFASLAMTEIRDQNGYC